MSERIINVTPEKLLDDNRSVTAKDRLGEWAEAENTKNLTAVWACSDSRLVLPYSKAVHIYTITAGGPRSPYSPLLKDQRVKAFAIVCHHDGDEAVAGRSPGGCGGRAAKESANNGNGSSEGVERFIEGHVWHSDLFKQAYTAGAFTAFRSEKPTLATSQDHLDLTIHPLAAFLDGGRDVNSQVPQHYITAYEYFPEKIYENGLPVLGSDKIPEVFNDFISENRQLSDTLSRRYKELRKFQKSQNPSILAFSTDIRPLSVRYPETTEVPGSVFRVSIPQQTIDGASIIDVGHLRDSLDQVNYPVAHFSNLKTILIETRSIDKSLTVAHSLVDRPWMRKWLAKEGNQILTGQVRKGETLIIEPFKG